MLGSVRGALSNERLYRDKALKSQGPRPSLLPKATCAVPLCEEPSPCRGLRPHHAWKDRVGTWETSFGPQSLVDPGPRQEVEETKLSRNRRGVGRLHSTDEASNKAD